MFLTSPVGLVVEIDDQYWIDRNLREGFRKSTVDEIEEYRARKQRAFEAQHASEPSPDGVYYHAVAPGADGYGMSRDIIKRELFRLGVRLDETYANQKVGFLYSHPYPILQLRNDVRLIYTMWESDKIPEDWPDYLSVADEVLVPSKWCADVFAKSGVKATVVPLGYNDTRFSYIDRPIPVEHNAPFTFIHYNSFNVRKGFFEVLNAFSEEFAKDENVRLILKSTDRQAPIHIGRHEYPNVEVLTGEYSEKQLSDLLGRANCMVYPSMGEGFGITPLEAMATGLPAIVPNEHGISEYFNDNYMLEVKAPHRSPALYARYKGQDVGEMVVCDVADLRKQMRYAFNHQAEMKQLGESASEYVKNFTYRRTAERLAEVIHKWEKTKVVKRGDSKYLMAEKI
jgi:glycosyltransferase involved in cell wall biosynthesis